MENDSIVSKRKLVKSFSIRFRGVKIRWFVSSRRKSFSNWENFVFLCSFEDFFFVQKSFRRTSRNLFKICPIRRIRFPRSVLRCLRIGDVRRIFDRESGGNRRKIPGWRKKKRFCDEKNQIALFRFQNYISNDFLTAQHRLYLILVDLYTFSFGSFPSVLFQSIEERRFTDRILSVRSEKRKFTFLQRNLMFSSSSSRSFVLGSFRRV